jgi:adenylyl cyclase-associated protein
MRIFFSL